MISDDIGSKAVRNFYDPTGEGFIARRAAFDAFLAGNDLLYMGGFLQDDTGDIEGEPVISGYEALLDTLDFFTQKYREDPSFAERVDSSVLRILTLKYKLYGFFTLTMVLASGEMADTSINDQVTFGVAQSAATLINPSIEELENVLPEPPIRSERIVIFTDSFDKRRCANCPLHNSISIDALSQAILDLYGQAVGGVIYSGNIASHSFIELQQMLDGQAASSAVDTNLRRAQWIIFLMLDVDPNRPESYALRRFLAERPDLARDKRVIAFAANAPYYLDATEISKLTAYYGLYSKTSAFVDVAARLLFKEIPIPEGASPVSIPGMGYDLISATSPDPSQVIELMIDLPGLSPTDESSPPNIGPTPRFRIGDTIPVRTGIIIDYNGNPVPDDTPVDFIVRVNGVEAPAISADTVNGSAIASVLIEQSGTIEIQAVAGGAQSTNLIVEIPEERPSATPSPTVTPTETATPEPTPTLQEPTTTPFIVPPPEPEITGIAEWLLALVISLAIGWVALRVGATMGQVRWGVRWGFATLIGGLLAYTYSVLQLPGAEWIAESPYHWGLMLFTFIGALLGWGIAVIIRAIVNGR
jgi:beta-N-acetylhexosaminidase